MCYTCSADLKNVPARQATEVGEWKRRIGYGTLVTFYALGVLRFLADPLANLYYDNLAVYAWVALFLIVGQGMILEMVTSFLIDRLRLVRFD
jgi:hypothetical protein